MSTGMRKWMEKDCPEIEYLSAQVLIDREELKQLRADLETYKVERDAMRAMIQMALVVLDEVCGNINPERGYADELETDVKRAIATLSLYNAKGE